MGISDNVIIQGVITFFGMATTSFWYGYVFGFMSHKKIKLLRENAWLVVLIAAVAFLLIWWNILNVNALIEAGGQVAEATEAVS